MKKFLLIIFSVCIVFGQDTDFETQYYYDTIYLQQGFMRQKYVKGGESFPLMSLGSELKRYPESQELYEKYFFMRMLGLGALIIGPIASSALINTDESSFISVYLGSLFLGAFAAFESFNKLNEAVWIYNREQLKRGNDGNEFEGDSNDWRWRESTP
ncbi:MAG TPA: hypothetical protein EYO79_01125 [Candidatus Marinimicrobia bacterium]|nr:hypothetical protein [Candidatus Neomarinimicrobiota bacterium]